MPTSYYIPVGSYNPSNLILYITVGRVIRNGKWFRMASLVELRIQWYVFSEANGMTPKY